MPFLLHYFGLSKSTEVLLLILIGIYYAIFDCACLEFKFKLCQIWDGGFHFELFSKEVETIIRYLLWTVVVVESFTTPLYLAFSIVVLWPALFEDRPTLLVPWLVTGFAKNVMPSVITLLVGTYTCFATDFQKPACWDFILAQIINHAPSIYLFLCVRSFYRELQCVTENTRGTKQPEQEKEIIVRRRKARLMKGYPEVFYESRIEEEIQLKCVSTFEDLMQRVKERKGPEKAKSLDSFLQSIVKKAEENEWNSMFDRSQRLFSKKAIRETIMRNFKITEDYVHIAKIHQNEEYHQLLSEDLVVNFPLDNEPITSGNFNSESNYELPSTIDLSFSSDSETQICSVLNYSATSLVDKNVETTTFNSVPKSKWREGKSLIPLPVSRFYVDPIIFFNIARCSSQSLDSEEVCQNDFSCQVSTLSKNILNSPPKEFLNVLPESTALSPTASTSIVQ